LNKLSPFAGRSIRSNTDWLHSLVSAHAAARLLTLRVRRQLEENGSPLLPVPSSPLLPEPVGPESDLPKALPLSLRKRKAVSPLRDDVGFRS
jgi:hypothetical protein